MSGRVKLAELVGWVERSDTHQPGDGYRYAQPILRNHQHGFTLVEMIIVIVITGIIGGMVAVFLRAPVQQYVDVARRADMTDIADTALRRVSRDLRLALPNSVRVRGAISGAGSCNGSETCFIEFLPTGSSSCASGAACLGGGRYRVGAGGTNDELSFDIPPDTTFEALGPMPTMVAGDQIVVYNLGITGADAYAGVNRAAVTAVPAGGIVTIAATQFPFDSPGHRFHVVSTPASYVCAPAPGGVGGTLTRWQGYPILPTQPVALPAGGASAVLATNVSACSFTYDTNVVAQRSGLVTMQLAITRDTETVTLYSATHVSNQP